MFGGITPKPLNNKYNLDLFDKVDNNFDTLGRTPVNVTINGTTGVFVALGQSRITNNSSSPATPYTVTNRTKVFNLNPYDGLFYICDDPVLGCSASAGYLRAGWLGKLGDNLVNAGKYTQVVIIPIGIGGSSVTEWNSTSFYKDRIRAVSAMLTDKGITPTAWLWQQGTTDSIASMAQATYETNLRAIISYQRSLPGRSGDKWMIAKDSIYGSSNTVTPGIIAAQTSVAGDANNSLGPNCDARTYPTYQDATPHFNDTGNDAIAGDWSARIQAVY